MNDTLVMLAGFAAIAAAAIASFADVAIVQNLLVGVGVGTLVARAVVRRLERRSDVELPPRRVRQIEEAWIFFFVSAAVLFGFVVLP